MINGLDGVWKYTQDNTNEKLVREKKKMIRI